MPDTPNIPTRHNNPLSIKYGDLTKQYVETGDASIGDKALDGGNFLKFKDANTGFNAAKDLLFNQFYKDLNVDDALKTWSNQGYGIKQIAQNIDPTKKVNELSDSDKDIIINNMAKREGFKPNYYTEAAKEFGGVPNYTESAKEFGGVPLGKTTQELAQTSSNLISKYTPGPVTSIGKTIAGNLPSSQTLIEMLTGSLAGPYAAPVMALTGRLLDPNLQNKSFGENALTFGKDTLLNAVFGRLLSGAGKVGSEIISPGSVTGEEIQKLLPFKPTTAQLTGSKVASLVENTFAARQKEAALDATGKIINDKGTSILQQLAGRSAISLTTPFKQELNIEKGLENQFDASKFASNFRGTAVSNIASQNSVPWNGQNIEGPIAPITLVNEARNLLGQISKSAIKPDPNSPVVRALNDIIKEYQLPQTQALATQGAPYVRPVNFKDMWETKKAIDDIAYSNPKSQQTFADARFKRLAAAANQDIENSIPQWPNQSQTALNLWNETKQIVAKRNDLFGSGPIEKSINQEDRAIGNIDKIINNPNELKKAMMAGKLQIPDQGNFTYISNNTRKDLAGYEFTQLMNRAKITDAQGNVNFDGNKLMQGLLDANKQESYRILFGSPNNPSSSRAYIEDFFKNIGKVQSGDPTGMSRYWALKLTANGLNLGSGLISGVNTGMTGGTAIVGGTVGLSALGKLFANPEYAKLLVKLTSNRGDLGMPIQVAGRVLAQGLRNMPMTLFDQDGNQIEGKINSEGKFVLPVNKGNQ